MSSSPVRVLVSACLLGQPVRYDGQSKGIVSDWLRELGAEGRVLAFCPEVAGGLPTPRPPAERQGERVVTESGLDVTAEFDHGARLALQLCQAQGIRFALLRRHGIRVFSEDQLPALASALALAACGSA
ncbi:DUF523 domain-containing protein [Aeromonas hydrophila]|uniref:DUF523 domain-containing protein n=1 Tax=Aeromonas hydrophila TaxID=644 RepID=UPI001F4C0E47|nr:DUF523 domain-containing protein [Aeromonas hydrophila]UNB58657.1 DUF523 domain-containing protein [Aeromonas hydrophila]